MELMVYIAILGIVVLVAGQAFSNSTKFRVRTTNMLKANDISERVVEMFTEDVSQMGAKTYKSSGGASEPDRFDKDDSVYMAAVATSGIPDSSSFFLNDDGDSLVLKRMRYDTAGAFRSVELVSWFSKGNSLYRRCETIVLNDDKKVDATAAEDCPISDDDPPTVLITENVSTFKVVAAKPGITLSGTETAAERSIILPEKSGVASSRPFRFVPRFYLTAVDDADIRILSVDPEQGGMAQSLSGFTGNYDYSDTHPDSSDKSMYQVFVAKANTGVAVQDGEYWKTLCSKVDLDSAAEYELNFKISYNEDNSRLFCPGRDHAAVGFRNLDGSKIAGLEDFLFYPPITNDEPPQRSFRFSVKHPVKSACIAFTFASYSPAPGGKITIQDFIFKQVESSNYVFDNSYKPATEDKLNVKAFQLHLVVDKGGETSDISQVVQTPSNGLRD
mgnify:CR=1 FL=1